MAYSWTCNSCLHLLLPFCRPGLVETAELELDQAMANADYQLDALNAHCNHVSLVHLNT